MAALTEADIRRALQVLGIFEGYRDTSSYEVLVSTARGATPEDIAAGVEPVVMPSEADLRAALAEVPPAQRREVRKSVVMARAAVAGKVDEGYLALTQSPVLFARWFAPDRPVVYSDDPDTIAFLTSLGLDADAMLAPEVE